MDYAYRVEQANDYDYPEYDARHIEPYDEDKNRWDALYVMANSSDVAIQLRGVQGMFEMATRAYGNDVNKLREIIDLMGQRITALTNENAQLKASINALETKHISAPKCAHGLPRGCCAVCAERKKSGERVELEREHAQRERGFVYDWNANVRADGAYQE